MLIQLLKNILSNFESFERTMKYLIGSICILFTLTVFSFIFEDLFQYTKVFTIFYLFSIGGYFYSAYRVNTHLKKEINSLIDFTKLVTPQLSNSDNLNIKSETRVGELIKLPKPLDLHSLDELNSLLKWAEEVEEYKFASLLKELITNLEK